MEVLKKGCLVLERPKVQEQQLYNSGVILKGVSETTQHEAKEQRGGFLSMLLGTLGASLLGNLWGHTCK